MKALIVLAAFVAVASAGQHYGGDQQQDTISTGTSSQFRQEDNYGNFQFGYDESHSSGGSSRHEEQSDGVRRGSYSLSDADGRRRVVNYLADARGFRATVHTNEPGVAPKDSANVHINKNTDGDPHAAYRASHTPAGYLAAAPEPLPLGPPAPAYGASKGAHLAGPRFASPAQLAHRRYGAAPPPPPPPPPPTPLPLAPPAPAYGAAPDYAPQAAVYERPTPRAFSYAFVADHVAPLAARSYGQPSYGPAPVQQRSLDY